MLTHDHLIQLYFPYNLLLPCSLDSGKLLAWRPGPSGPGVSAPLMDWLSGSDQEGALPVSKSPDGFQTLVPPCHVLPHTALLPEAPPELWAACEHILLPLSAHPPQRSLALTPLCLAAHDSSPQGTRNGRWQLGV